MASEAFGIERFMVSSSGRRFLCQAFRASDSLFLIFGLQKETQKHKNGTGKDIPFSCD